MGVITTIENKCKRCYSCIRNCPAKAIRVQGGQAWVMEERCVACGYCVRVCAQGAKRIEDGVAKARALLGGDAPAVLALAPSFPVAFSGIEPGKVVAAAKAAGFAEVVEVAFGAELVSWEYRRLMESGAGPVIATPCPSVVRYIEKYHPSLVPMLAPVVSPMIATARAIKRKYMPGAKVVFAGPCIAKKAECSDPSVDGDIDAVLTFAELRRMFAEAGILPDTLNPSEFEGPAPYLGRIFPVPGGLLRTAALEYDVVSDEVVVTEGRGRVLDVLKSIEAGRTHARFFDLLFCEGCINGPIMPLDTGLVVGKQMITEHLKQHARVTMTDPEYWQTLDDYACIDMSRGYEDDAIIMDTPTEEQIRDILRQIKKEKPEDELNCGVCGYRSCREKAIAVWHGIAENDMCLPFIVEQLIEYNKKLKDTQAQLFRAEKLASVGSLAAGIAHEINNPLGGILLYANILSGAMADDEQKQNLQTIIDETIRCREIVKGVLDFSRQREPRFEPIAVGTILDRVFDLVEKQALFQNITIEKKYKEREDVPEVHGDASQLQQVFMNIIVNAAQSITEGGTVSVDTVPNGSNVDVSIEDTGCGIAPEALHRIFDPFYTTKGPKKGTGLGLSTSHTIIEKHNGEILVASAPGKGSNFTVRLPRMPENPPESGQPETNGG